MPENKTSSGSVKFAKDIFAGTCGGIAVTLIGHPFDTVKVRLQTQPSAKPIYSGAIDCVRKTIQWEGPKGLYKGVASPLAGQMFFRASLFSAFGQAKSWYSVDSNGRPCIPTNLDLYKAGAITGFIAAFTEAPIDFYKSQLQVQVIRSQSDPSYKPKYTTVPQTVRATIEHNGFRGPFQGLATTIVRNTPANSIYLGSFEVLKKRAAESYGCTQQELANDHPFTVLSAAGVGGLLYWMMIFPVDVVKSAIMTDSIVPAERKYTGMISTAQKLYAEGGIGRFYKGFSPCLMRAVPANACMLYTVDKVNALLK
ncbi:hypothetical protein WJX84_011011 [Apatococcus fuscideae]|uniref:Uncharacterized protein n=1 Tax=Apatococcus fuscideae TaxID=2026836 RepID=A0AAW1T4B1_9CHLO